MTGQAATIGPFKDGIRLAMLANSDSPTDALDIVNFDILTDGALHTRPQLKPVTVPGLPVNKTVTPIGYHTEDTGAVWIIFVETTGTYAWSGGSTPVTKIASFQISAMVQYVDAGSKATSWMVTEDNTGYSGKWRPELTTIQAVSGMPLGRSILVRKDRLLVAGVVPNEVRYSKAGDANEWATTSGNGGYFLVRPGDGGYISKLVPYNDQVLIFKSNGIWSLSFTADPGEGSLRNISPNIGITHQRMVVAREDIVVFYFNKRLFGMNNNTLVEIQRPLMENFSYNYLSPSPGVATRAALYDEFICFTSRNRIMLYLNGLYWVYHLEQQAWTRYDFGSAPIGPVLEVRSFNSLNLFDYYAGSLTVGVATTYQSVEADTLAAPGAIAFDASILTKSQVFGDTGSFKRLFYWGVDAVFRGNMTATVIPIVIQTPVTWRQLMYKTQPSSNPRKWNEITGTWETPLGVTYNVKSTLNATNYLQRSFSKFPLSLRFRKLSYKVTFTRADYFGILYGIVSYVAIKERVFAKES